MLRTFFRHYSLYEYSFKPKVDIILMTMPENVNQESAMGPGSEANASLIEASKANDEIGEINLDGTVPNDALDEKASSVGRSRQSRQDREATGQATPQLEGSKQESKENLNSSGQVDWSKVGKIYKPDSAIEDILQKEMGRLGKAFDMAIDNQEVELEEKYRGSKKK